MPCTLALSYLCSIKEIFQKQRPSVMSISATRRVGVGGCELPWHLMHMTTYQQAVRVLQPVIQPTYDAIQAGLEQATEDHAIKRFRRRDDPHYYLHTVRRVAVKQLQSQGLQAIDDTSSKPLLALSSILIPFKGLAVKVLHTRKDDAGHLIIPIPGRSRRGQAFWQQEASSALPGMVTDNMLLLWIDDMGDLVDPMLLVRPTGGDHRRYSLRFEWAGKLSRDMASLRAADLDELTPAYEYRQMGGGESG